MCGINGVSFHNEDLIRRMNEKIIHRGRDDSGMFADEKISLGHQRLSIIDLSESGHQPMFSDDKNLILVFNGEIYNYEKIQNELKEKGYVFRSNSDSEVILTAYQEWGKQCVKKLDGMWAFCIYDKENKELFLSRDRFGIKPLYYFCDNENLIFSSEIKGILECDKYQRAVNENMVFDFLYHQRVDHTHETFFKDIFKLPAAHNATFDLGNRALIFEQYWDIDLEKEAEGDFETRKNEVKQRFEESMKLHLVSDVPVGSCLSGGIDSSAIVCSMANLETKELHTFSSIFKGKRVDESQYIDIVTQKVQAQAHSVSPTAEDLLSDMDDLVYTQEEPFLTTSIYAQHRVMKLANESNMKVLLDGQGADELLGGYHTHFIYFFIDLLRRFRWIRFTKEAWTFHKIHKYKTPIAFAIASFAPAFVKKMYHHRKRHVRIMKNDFIKQFKKRSAIPNLPKSLNAALKQQLQSGLLSLLRYEDKNSMRWTIESRVPFLQKDLVEYLFSCPDEDKLNKGTSKFIFREAMTGILPDEIKNRQDKIGFATPGEEWFREQVIRDYVDRTLKSDMKVSTYVDIDQLRSYWEDHKSGKYAVGALIWQVVCLEKWLGIYFSEEMSS